MSIVNGGATKRITKTVNLQWLFDSFEVVLFKYLNVLYPLRSIQEQLSKELKIMGFSGNIHGCIVDVDYYHHIKVDPVESSIEFYYSPLFGVVQILPTFRDVLLSKRNNLIFNERISEDEYNSIVLKFDNLCGKSTCLLNVIGNNNLLEWNESDKSNLYERELIEVSRKEGFYGLSRKVNPLQRLFSKRVLRSFDVRLAEIQPENVDAVQKSNRTFLSEHNNSEKEQA